jgi:Trk K+ transport system NAD-binding subunit
VSEAYVYEIDGGLAMIRTPIMPELVGKEVKDLNLPDGIKINVVYRRKRPLLVEGSTQLKKNDELLLIGKTKPVYKLADEIKELLESKEKEK